jgi:hypothetical protein
MMLFTESHSNLATLDSYLAFNSIEHHQLPLWSNHAETTGEHWIPDEVVDQPRCVLVVTVQWALKMLARDRGVQRLQQYLNNADRRLWLYADADGWLFIHTWGRQAMQTLDNMAQPDQCHVTLDARPQSDHWIHQLRHLSVSQMPYPWFTRALRLPGPLTKSADSRAFMITTCVRPDRPHRLLLQQKMEQLGLDQLGWTKFAASCDPEAWLGQWYPYTGMGAGYPSMDIYSRSYFEIVPETMHDGGCFYTEKTNKAIMTCTPFVMVTAPGYLKYLRDLGYQTFGHVIDESYDDIEDMPARVDAVIHCVQGIIKMGARRAYELCRPQIMHNRLRLHEIHGSWELEHDAYLRHCLQTLGYVSH